MMNYMKSAFTLLCYLDKELVAIGYLDNFDLDFIFLNDTHQVIIDERYLLQKGPVIMNWIKVAQLSVTVINEVIEIMKENRMEKNSMNINRYITRGINESIPLDLQILLWNMVKERDNQPHTDYLHILDYKKMRIYSITHEQEQPAYKLEYHYINYVKSKHIT